MLSRADVSLRDSISSFAEFGVEAGYFVPTQTAIKKSIVDAHFSLRDFLALTGVHNFDNQGQGNSEHGVKLKINLITESGFMQRSISMYRPKTKKGDPRFWFNLVGFASPENLIAILVSNDLELFAVNCSDSRVMRSRHTSGSPLNTVLGGLSTTNDTVDLLEEIREIAQRGWVDSTRSGDTAVGHTLETLLGIAANSSKNPDYRGTIEIKSGRRPPSGRAKNRSTMLSKVPNWKASPFNAAQILGTFGKVNAESGRMQLYVTVSNTPNRQGLYFLCPESSGFLENRAKLVDGDRLVAVWEISNLQQDLKNKHKETFWVQAQSRLTPSGEEQFLFTKVVHTRAPLVSNLAPLIEAGVITLDYTLSDKPSGGVRDHGYLFRIWPKDLSLIFPSVQEYELVPKDSAN